MNAILELLATLLFGISDRKFLLAHRDSHTDKYSEVSRVPFPLRLTHYHYLWQPFTATNEAGQKSRLKIAPLLTNRGMDVHWCIWCLEHSRLKWSISTIWIKSEDTSCHAAKLWCRAPALTVWPQFSVQKWGRKAWKCRRRRLLLGVSRTFKSPIRHRDNLARINTPGKLSKRTHLFGRRRH